MEFDSKWNIYLNIDCNCTFDDTGMIDENRYLIIIRVLILISFDKNRHMVDFSSV